MVMLILWISVKLSQISRRAGIFPGRNKSGTSPPVFPALNFSAVLLIATLFPCPLFAVDAAERRCFRGPYLAAGGADRMTIVWRTIGDITPVVRIGSAPTALERAITSTSRSGRILSRRADGVGGWVSLHSARDGAVQYEATILGLTPATTFYYAIFDGGTLIAGGDVNHKFRTSPPPGSTAPLRFWVVGDSGTGEENQAAVHRAMINEVGTLGRKPLDFYMHVGDMAYGSGTNEQFQRNFFAVYDLTLRNTVCWPSMGNHEGGTSQGATGIGPYYDAYVLPRRGEIGGTPSGTEAYYSFVWGNAHFVCLDSHDLDRRPTGKMARWLKADLAAAKAAWLIAFWHHPPYTKGTHDSDIEHQLIEMREHIMPILEDRGVDMGFTGHSHIYERSMLVDGAYATPTVAEHVVLDDGDGSPAGDGAYRKSAGLISHNGTVQVVTGHGGAGVGRSGTMPIMKKVHVEHGSVIVDIDNDTLTAVMINKEGTRRDVFSIVKKGIVTPTRIASPKQLPFYGNWASIKAIARLSAIAPDGTPMPVRVDIAATQLKAPVSGALEWATADTNWTITPARAALTLVPGKPTVLTMTAAVVGDVFPLAVPTLKLATKNGEKRGSAVLLLPAYKTTTIGRLPGAPRIDGVLADAEMAGLQRQRGMIRYDGKGPAATRTEFALGHHGDKLYIAVVNHQDVAGMVLRNHPRDGKIWDDNCNEIFIQPVGGDYVQFVVGPQGQVFDAKGTPDSAVWNGEFTVAVVRGIDRWTVEMLIDLSKLGDPLRKGDKLRFNLVRNDLSNGELSQWSHTNQRGNHQPRYFGTVEVK